MGEKVGSKGEIQGAGLVPISLTSDCGDDRMRNGSKLTLLGTQQRDSNFSVS